MAADILDLNEKRLERLSPRQLSGELMRLPAKKRLELILERPDSAAIVAALDANDFFYSVQEIGPDDALPLLALAKMDQVNHLFDLEWWRKDSLEPAKALTWLERLARASDHKLLEWLYTADFELLVSLFKQWVNVATIPDDIDLLEARDTLPSKTLDDIYFWESRYPQYEDLVAHILTILFEINYGFFKELMNSAIFAVTVEVEEQAYHFHRARLADHAIPDFYEALEIYKTPKPNEPPKTISSETADEEHTLPSFALALVPEGDLLGRVLRRIENPELAETIQLELASLSNKVVVADQLPADNTEVLRQAVEKALAYVNLGLELRSEGNLENAGKIIEDVYLEYLFRLANSEISRIKGRLRMVAEHGWIAQYSKQSEYPAGIKCLDEEWLDTAEKLLGKTPKLLRKMQGEDALKSIPREDFFRTLQDLERGNRIVDVITAAGYLYKALSADPAGLALKLWEDGQIRVLEDITLGVLILTAAAQFLASGKWNVEPIALGDWPGLFPLLQPTEIDRAVMDWVFKTMPDQQTRTLAEAYLSPILRDYDFEMRPFSGQNPPEPQMVKFFLFTENR
jgi:hypothetical protein